MTDSRNRSELKNTQQLAPGLSVEDVGDSFYVVLEIEAADVTFAFSDEAAEALAEFLHRRLPRHGISR